MGLNTSWLKIQPFPRRYNVKPTQDIYVVLNGEVILARWGLIPTWHIGELKDWRASTINARIEELTEKSTYREPWKHGRCLIPVSGFYEWTGDKSPK